MSQLSEQLEISLGTAVTVVVTCVVVYLAFIVLVRVMGARVLTGTSSFDLACVVAFGAILGRTVLLADPTLAIGLVALCTFVGMQAALGLLRRSPALFRWINSQPVLLVSDGRLLADNLRHAHVVEDEVRQAARRAGARSLDELQCVVLERNGALSVIRSGARMDPWLLEDVVRSRGAGPPTP
jgi:uncharacterized membrane protein YcaP (DUF421 family)